jgi:hypothetical protein
MLQLHLDPNNAVLAAHEHTVQPTSKSAERNRFSLLFGALPFRQIGCAAAVCKQPISRAPALFFIQLSSAQGHEMKPVRPTEIL